MSYSAHYRKGQTEEHRLAWSHMNQWAELGMWRSSFFNSHFDYSTYANDSQLIREVSSGIMPSMPNNEHSLSFWHSLAGINGPGPHNFETASPDIAPEEHWAY